MLIDSHGVRPERTVYVDDKDVNVDAAVALGMTGLVFTDPAALRSDLVRLGVLPDLPLGQDVAVPDVPAARPGEGAVWRGDAVPDGAGPSVVTIGVFDGVHRGHQVVVGRAAARARAAGVPCVAITFDPNPADVVGRGEPQPRLGSVEERVRLLQAAGADAVWVLPFTTELSQLTPEEFVADMLVGRLAPVAVVVGADFRFGHRAAGTVETLRTLGATHGFEVDDVPLVGRDDPGASAAWSSTAVRGLLAEGRVDAAAAALGRPYRIEGEVVHGDHRGRELASRPPTSPSTPRRRCRPTASTPRSSSATAGSGCPAAVSVGTNPTFDGTVRRVEAYVLDVDPADLDLYGEHVVVELVARLRGMERFDSVDDLVAQMAADVDGRPTGPVRRLIRACGAALVAWRCRLTGRGSTEPGWTSPGAPRNDHEGATCRSTAATKKRDHRRVRRPPRPTPARPRSRSRC